MQKEGGERFIHAPVVAGPSLVAFGSGLCAAVGLLMLSAWKADFASLITFDTRFASSSVNGSLAIFLAASLRPPNQRSIRLLPIIAATIVAVATLLAWNALKTAEEKNNRAYMAQLTRALVQAVDADLTSKTLAMNRMAKRWEMSGGIPRPLWDADAESYAKDFGAKSVNWADSSGIVRWVSPLAGNESTVNFDLTRDSRLRQALADARATRSLVFTPPLRLAQVEGSAIVGFNALYVNNKLDGYIFVPIPLDSILERISPTLLPPHTQASLSADNQLLAKVGRLEGPEIEGAHHKPPSLLHAADIFVHVSHDQAFLATHSTHLPQLLLVAGLLTAGLLGMALWYWAAANMRTRESEAAGAQIKDREARLAAIVDTSVEGIIIIDDRGIVESINPAAEKLFGYANDEVAGRNVSMLMPEPHQSEHDSYMRRYLDTGTPHVIGIGREVEGLRKNGETFPMDLAVSEMNVNGRRMFTGMLRDVSERKANDLALREKQRLIDSVVENIPAMIFMKRADDLRFVLFNKAGEKLLGYSREELLGKNDYDFFPREQADFFTGKDREVLASSLKDIPEESIDTRNQGIRILHTKKIVLHDDDGNPQYLLGISEDITERKAAEVKLIQAKEEAERANLAKSQFLATVSHELRTPLTSITGTLGLLASGSLGELPAQASQMLDIALKNSKRLAHLINDLLDMEKMAADKMRLELVAQPLMPLVEQSLQSIRAYADQFQVRLELTARADDVHVRVDGERLQQILHNLLSNAIKFSSAGGRVETAVRCNNNIVRVEVLDQGPGIPSEFRSRIFQKFSQADSSDSRKITGSGLGLAISKELAERMGGSVGFVSEQGQGACFYVELPAQSQRIQNKNEA